MRATATADVGSPHARDEQHLVEALRGGDEAAFAALVDRYHAALVRLAGLYVADRAAAEEVVQDTWLGVVRGIERFQARSSLKTWLFQILVNRAKTRGVRERRTIPFSSLAAAEQGHDERAVAPQRFLPADHP